MDAFIATGGMRYLLERRIDYKNDSIFVKEDPETREFEFILTDPVKVK